MKNLKKLFKKVTYFTLLSLVTVLFLNALFFSNYEGPKYEFTCSPECSFYCPCLIIVDSNPVSCNVSLDCESPLACSNNVCGFMEEPFHYQYTWQISLLFMLVLFAFYKLKKLFF